MADLTANKPRTFQGEPGTKFAFPMPANSQLFAGALLMVSAAGYAANCTPTASGRFLGVAHEAKDNRTGSVYGGTDNSTTIEVVMRGILVLKSHARSTSTWGQADIGATMYALDGDTPTEAAGTNNIVIGKILALSALGAATADVYVAFESTMLRSI